MDFGWEEKDMANNDSLDHGEIYDVEEQRTAAEEIYATLNTQQRSFVDRVKNALLSKDPKHPKLFFLDGPGKA